MMTRSPLRIPRFSRAIEELWKQHSEQRFGQLIMNLTRNEDGTFADPWEWEDSEWYRRIGKAWDEWGSPL